MLFFCFFSSFLLQFVNLLLQAFDFFTLVLDGRQQRVQLFVFDGRGEFGLNTQDEVRQHVHVVVESIIRIVVRAEATATHVLGVHVVEVVTALQIIPVLTDTTSLAQTNTWANLVDLAEGLLLQDITQPRAAVALPLAVWLSR